jgi:hypothetical protein
MQHSLVMYVYRETEENVNDWYKYNFSLAKLYYMNNLINNALK